jgi:hypothetical protein
MKQRGLEGVPGRRRDRAETLDYELSEIGSATILGCGQDRPEITSCKLALRTPRADNEKANLKSGWLLNRWRTHPGCGRGVAQNHKLEAWATLDDRGRLQQFTSWRCRR